MIGESALAFQEKVERGEEKVVGVNCYQFDEDQAAGKPTERPDLERMKAHVARFKAFKESRSRSAVESSLAALGRAAHDRQRQHFRAAWSKQRMLGVTHGEIVACLRKELGFGRPLIVA